MSEDTEDEPRFDEPEEGDYITYDHRKFYQYGKLVLTVPDEYTSEEMVRALREYMDREKFWPNAWWISDHGNSVLLDLRLPQELSGKYPNCR
jgi:hypothetical protein